VLFRSGLLDLTGWQVKKEHVKQIKGEWRFYWNRLLTPQQIANQTHQHEVHHLYLPGVWNHSSLNDMPLPGEGKATLELNLKLPSAYQHYVLKVPMLTNRYQLWINGELKVTDPEINAPFRIRENNERTRFISFETRPNSTASIVFQLVNHRHRDGGIWEPLTLSPSKYEQSLRHPPIVHDVVIAFLLSLITVILLIKAAREQQVALLFLALFSLLMALRAGIVNERLLFSILNIHDWEFQQTIEYVCLYASVPFFALYLGLRFPGYFPPALHLATSAICGALILLVLITPASVYSYSAPVFQLVVIIYVLLWLGVMIDHIHKGDTGAIPLFIGGMIFITASINDILFTNNLINSTNLAHYGALAFIVFAYFTNTLIPKTQPKLTQSDMPHQTLNLIDTSTQNHNELLSPIVNVDLYQDTTSQTFKSHPLATEIIQFESTGEESDFRHLMVSALSFGLRLWELRCKKDKLSLAKESGFWRLTNDGGTLKTRTLDKYLKTASLPKNPRYKQIVQTLRFVAIQEVLLEEEKRQLESLADFCERSLIINH
jgi:hypothetical protein